MTINICSINRKKILIGLVLLAFLSSSKANAQQVNQSNAWFMYFGNHRLNDKVGVHTEYQFRRSEFASNWQQSLMRVGVDYYLPQKAMATAGYGWIVSFPYGAYPIKHEFTEHRIWEQFVLQDKIGRCYFHHRYRLEQRFLENYVQDTSGIWDVDGFNFRQRGRYRILVSVPLSNKEMVDNTLFVSAYDEVFLGFGKGIQKNVLDQNRLFFSLGWKFDSKSNVQIGYLNQYVIKPDGSRRENNHTLQLAYTYNMDFRNEK